MTQKLAFPIGTLLLLLLSCGGDGGQSGGGSLCQQIGNAVCTKACACRDGAACAITQDALTLDFENEADCRTLFVTFGCSMGDKAAYNDAAACLPLVQSAMCATTGPEGALAMPANSSCESPD